VAVPLLILLYVLKLRRREVPIASTFLWSRSVQDLQANTLFQRLRFTLLFLIQLLILLLLLMAAARPITSGTFNLFGTSERVEERLILLIDVSASMMTVEHETATTNESTTDQTRFELAQHMAHTVVDRMSRGRTLRKVMIITVGSTSKTVCSWTADPKRLHAVIDSLRPVEVVGYLQPALRLAGAHVMQPAGRRSSDGIGQTPPARVLLFSDGRFADAETPVLEQAALEYIPVVPSLSPSDNIGFITLSARRDYNDPASVDLLCVLMNTRPISQVVAVPLEVDGTVIETQTVTIPTTDSDTGLPGRASVRFRFHAMQSVFVRVHHTIDDQFPVDNSAGLILLPPEESAVLVVSSDGSANSFLIDLLDLMNLSRLDQMSLPGFERQWNPDRSGNSTPDTGYNLFIFDGVSPSFVPPVSSLSFGGVPPLNGVVLSQVTPSDGSTGETPVPLPSAVQRVLSWERDHPVLTYVNLDQLAISDPHRLTFVSEETGSSLAVASDGVLIGNLQQDRFRHVVVSFDLMQSNWPIHVSFAVFLQNSIEYLTTEGTPEAGRWFRADETPTIQTVGPDVDSISLHHGDQSSTILQLEPNEDQTVTLPPLGRTGYYEVQGAAPPNDRLIINLLSEVESNITPVEDLNIESISVQTRAIDQAVPRELWPWFVGAAFGMMLIEWWLYSRRAAA